MNLPVVITIIVTFLIAFLLGGIIHSSTTVIYNQSGMQTIAYGSYCLNGTANYSSAQIIVPAVDQNGMGVATQLKVEVEPGRGKVLTNIENLLFWVDTQNSIRTALSVAKDYLQKDISNQNIIYTIKANASVIEGPSAGAALTVATIAALSRRELNKSIMITGTINHDGTIGPIGGALSKAQAAKSIGAELFLVPITQSIETSYETQRHCEPIGWGEYCTIETVPKRVDIQSTAGIRVAEVENIDEAVAYFLE